MKRFFNSIFICSLGMVLVTTTSCDNWLDINKDPDNLVSAPISLQIASLTTSTGFAMGSDLNRYSSLIVQQYSGQTTGGETQTQTYEKYQISPTDANNAFSLLFATILNTSENIIAASGTESPHYSGVAKLIKAYTYQVSLDTWGDLPYSEAQQLSANLNPAYDDDKEVYTKLIALINEGISEVSSPTSVQSPGVNSQIYNAAWSTAQEKWVKFGNTLKMRLFIHYSEVDPTFANQQITALVSSGAKFFENNTDNFQVNFLATQGGQNPIHQFEVSRAGYLVANKTLVSLMNEKSDPRRSSFFTDYPAGSGLYVGAVGGAPASQNYSKFHTYLRGAVSGSSYTGQSPLKMLTFSEYNFIRAEAALRFGSPGNADEFFKAGIKASMQDAGVSATNIDTYIASKGSLTGSDANKLKQIIEEKFVANYGVAVESWSDWRRTGIPSITPPQNAIHPNVPRSLFYPQSEDDNNRSFPGQKANLDVRVFWDTRK